MIVSGHSSQRRVAPWTGRAGPAAAFYAQSFAQRFSQKHGQRQRSPGPCVSERVDPCPYPCTQETLVDVVYCTGGDTVVDADVLASFLTTYTCSSALLTELNFAKLPVL